MNRINTINRQATAQRKLRRVAAWLPAALAFVLLGLWNLGAPAPWWDEGWTLSVARTWVERGIYGRLLMGQPAPNGLEASFFVTGPVAASFKLFGVGLWQGRVFGVVCVALALALIAYLAAQLYKPGIAVGTLAVLLLLSMHPQLHPLIQGRQVLAEMPMLAYLLAGYVLLLLALRTHPAFILAAALAWGLARLSKAQVGPFWTMSLLAPLAVALLQRRWRTAVLLGGGLVGTFLASQGWQILAGWVLQGRTLPGTPVSGIYAITALVFEPMNRRFALFNALTFGLTTLLGLLYASWALLRRRATALADDAESVVRLALLVLAGSWFAWFTLLSVGVPRYLFPATFVGSIFVAALLHDLTGGYKLAFTLQHSSAAIARLRWTRQSLGALAALVLIAMSAALTVLALQRYYFAADSSAAQVADFFNTRTPPETLIETYESELHFLLNRPYHYPPDQVHVELNRRGLLHQQDVVIDYDPLAADPDYLVVGEFSRGNQLYQPWIDAGKFRLMQHIGGYELYERVR